MLDELVLRSVKLTRSEDLAIREFAHKTGIRVGELIRAAVASRIGEWEASGSDTLLDDDLAAVTSATPGR
ncbi:hypothetical protein FHT76_000797 [Rhizobium sp. BK176]|nr:hypothetical protein [Rhizobium sp. BK176]